MNFELIASGPARVQSKYIPRALSGFYVFASLILLFCSYPPLIFPNISKVISPAWILLDFLVELLVGLWISIKGIKTTEMKS